MEILPAWLIEEIRKLEELKRQQERPRVYIEPPPQIPPRSRTDQDVPEDEDFKIEITLR